MTEYTFVLREATEDELLSRNASEMSFCQYIWHDSLPHASGRKIYEDSTPNTQFHT